MAPWRLSEAGAAPEEAPDPATDVDDHDDAGARPSETAPPAEEEEEP